MPMRLPPYRPLSPEDVKKIDQTSRQILERVGIRILEQDYLDILKAAGAIIDQSDQKVRFEAAWLDEVLARAPSQFVLYSRD
ncbi:MAG: methyltransferase, partial [Desulfobacterales bacterium]|nr:methyltransferase [Desulfobacterales bacterium]